VVNVECGELFVMNFIIFVLSKFNYIISSKPFNHTRTKFDTQQKSSKFLLEIMTLVSSANNMGSDTEFILRGRSFIYIYYKQQRP
jgi:hypothetical protein